MRRINLKSTDSSDASQKEKKEDSWLFDDYFNDLQIAEEFSNEDEKKHLVFHHEDSIEMKTDEFWICDMPWVSPHSTPFTS